MGRPLRIEITEKCPTLALTPALSPRAPRERENRSPLTGAIGAFWCSCGSGFEQPGRSENGLELRRTKRIRKLSPLPGGEGQGEGECHTIEANSVSRAPSEKRQRTAALQDASRATFLLLKTTTINSKPTP